MTGVDDVVVERTGGGLSFRDPENSDAWLLVEDVDHLAEIER